MNEIVEKPSPIERLAEHLCARRPCGETPENVADWLAYSLNRCGLVVIDEQRLDALTAHETAMACACGGRMIMVHNHPCPAFAEALKESVGKEVANQSREKE